jgi:hypothetical protein
VTFLADGLRGPPKLTNARLATSRNIDLQDMLDAMIMIGEGESMSAAPYILCDAVGYGVVCVVCRGDLCCSGKELALC